MAVTIHTLAQGTVTTPGTEVRLSAASISNVVKAYVSAPTANTGSIYVGDASVSVTRGIEVPKGTTLVLEAQEGQLLDLYNTWVDAATGGDDFNVTYYTKV